MRSLLIVASLLLSSAVLADPSDAPSGDARKIAKTLHLAISEDHTLEHANVRRVALDDPKVAGVTVGEDGRLRVTGLAAGRATLIVWQGRAGEAATRSVIELVVE